ncbi:MAG: hypothetical protein ACFFC5_00315 [Promethearchaeota archaeon]
MTKSESIRSRCKLCDIIIDIPVPKDFDASEGGVAPIVYVHGNPPHTIIAYVDVNLSVRSSFVVRTTDPKKALTELRKKALKRMVKRVKSL